MTTVNERRDNATGDEQHAEQQAATEEQQAEQAGGQDDGQQDADDTGGGQDQPETFPRAYVEQLRRESAGYRERAGLADDLAKRLHTALVAATGRLADPTDLPFDETHLDGAEALTTAIDELVEKKPHLKSRRVAGDVGQGAGGVTAADVDLAAMLRSRA